MNTSWTPLVADIDRLCSIHAPHLSATMASLEARARNRRFRVGVIGSFNTGKSSLVNALAGRELVRTSPIESTSHATVIAQPGVPALPPDERPRVLEEIVAEDLALSADLELVDTAPLGVAGGRLMLSATVAGCNAVLLVTDASAELTAIEVDTLSWLRERSIPTIVVVNRIDMHIDWRRVLERTTEQVKTIGADIDVLAVSAELWLQGSQTLDDDLERESGIDGLRHELNDRFSGRLERIVRRDVRSTLRWVVEQLQTLAALGNSAETLAERHARLQKLRSSSTRWRRSLAEGFQEVSADLEDQFAVAIRRIAREADEVISERDPATSWDELEAWVRQRLEATAAEVVDRLLERTDAAIADVVQAIDTEGGITMPPVFASPPSLSDSLELAPTSASVRASSTRSLVALRSSYSGVLMFGMAGTLLGLAVINPISLVLGAGLGGKAIRDDRKRQLDGRRKEARQAISRYLEDARPMLRQELRSTVRHLQREIRATVEAHIEQLLTAVAHEQHPASADLASELAALHQRIDQL